MYRTASSHDLPLTEEECAGASFSSCLEDPRRSRQPVQSPSTSVTFTYPLVPSSVRQQLLPPQQRLHNPVEAQRPGQRESDCDDGRNHSHVRKRPAQLCVGDKDAGSVSKKLCTEHASTEHASTPQAARNTDYPCATRGEPTTGGSTSATCTTGTNHTAQLAVENFSPISDVSDDESSSIPRWPDDSQLPAAQPPQPADINFNETFAPPPSHHPPQYKQGSWMPHGGRRKRTAHADSEEIHMFRMLAPTFREYALNSRQSTEEQEVKRESVGNYRCVTIGRGKHLKTRDLVGSIMDEMRR